MLILVDSGVLLRLMERTDPLHGVIRQAVRTLVGQGHELVGASQNFAEFWNVCTRPATSRGGLGLDIRETDRRARVLERILAILPDSSADYRLWRQIVVKHAVQGKQVHDARLAALMSSYGITHILTLNSLDFSRYPGIIAIDPTKPSSAPPPTTP